MFRHLVPAVRATISIALLTGIAFPISVTLLSTVFFNEQGKGSLIRNSTGEVIGSSLIGQAFSRPEYFHPRPSAAGSGYAGESSAGSNLGPTSRKLFEGQKDDPSTAVNESFDGVKQLSEAYRVENRLSASEKVPVDAVSRSASGLDPHISFANALFQSRRVSEFRKVPIEKIRALVESHLEGRQLGFIGEPRINVLQLNLALDQAR